MRYLKFAKNIIEIQIHFASWCMKSVHLRQEASHFPINIRVSCIIGRGGRTYWTEEQETDLHARSPYGPQKSLLPLIGKYINSKECLCTNWLNIILQSRGYGFICSK